MKKILISVKVPDGSKVQVTFSREIHHRDKSVSFYEGSCEFEEVNIPTDKEIEDAVDPHNRCGRGWFEGALWLKHKILNQ